MNEMFPYLLTAHVFGVILWVGGVLAGGRILLLRLDDPGSEALANAEGKVFKSIAAIGLAIALLFGILVLGTRASYYMKQGWFHAKLALALVFLVLHMALRVLSKRLPPDPATAPRNPVRAILGASAATALAILVLVFTQPF